MLLMLKLENETHVIFFHVGQMKQAKQYRRDHPEFKRRRITEILQAGYVPMETLLGKG
jgi:hypothetical protein